MYYKNILHNFGVFINGQLKAEDAEMPRIFQTKKEAQKWANWYMSIASFKAKVSKIEVKKLKTMKI